MIYIPIVLIIILLIWFIIGYTVFFKFLGRRHRKKKHKKKLFDSSPSSFRMDREWLNSVPVSHAYIASEDGLTLHAQLIPGENTNRFVICCHAYRANGTSMAGFAHLFHDLGFSVLLPDARAHGQSEGRYIGMGRTERKDIIRWIKYILQSYPDAKIVLFGVSMGAATVMNTVGELLPENVICAIEDCGYSSIRKIFEYQLRQRNLPAFLLYTAAPFAKVLAGFSALSLTDTISALGRCRIPMLMIHGSADTFVPLSHLKEVSEACSSTVDTIVIPDAGHAESIVQDYRTYRSAVSNFIERVI